MSVLQLTQAEYSTNNVQPNLISSSTPIDAGSTSRAGCKPLSLASALRVISLQPSSKRSLSNTTDLRRVTWKPLTNCLYVMNTRRGLGL